MEIKIDSNLSKMIYEICKNEKKILFKEELIDENRYPSVYQAICFIKKIPWFYINKQEQLMTAGWSSKEDLTFITFFRWNYKKIKDFLLNKIQESHLKNLGIPVSMLLPRFSDKIGILKGEIEKPDFGINLDYFDQEVSEVVQGKRTKTSALFYGPPGNGKTFYVKYLSYKYKLPMMVLTLNPTWDNHSLLLIFSQIPKKCIVLLEDFDNYFDKRKVLFGPECRFTFDVFLNGLDGVYNTHEQVIFIMTANDIDKIDVALKERPSRFKYVKCFGNPDLATKQKMIGDWANKIDNFNLDQLFRLKEYKELGDSFEQAMNKFEKKIEEKSIVKIKKSEAIELL